jgi:hypothetical protein
MFMMMDDVGNLSWRFGRKLLVSSGEEDRSHPQNEHKQADR